MLDGWAYVESDFQRFYQLDPLSIGWRRFLVLFKTLSPDGVFASYVKHVDEVNDPDWWKDELARQQGSEYKRPEKVMSIDDWVSKETGR